TARVRPSRSGHEQLPTGKRAIQTRFCRSWSKSGYELIWRGSGGAAKWQAKSQKKGGRNSERNLPLPAKYWRRIRRQKSPRSTSTRCKSSRSVRLGTKKITFGFFPKRLVANLTTIVSIPPPLIICFRNGMAKRAIGNGLRRSSGESSAARRAMLFTLASRGRKR